MIWNWFYFHKAFKNRLIWEIAEHLKTLIRIIYLPNDQKVWNLKNQILKNKGSVWVVEEDHNKVEVEAEETTNSENKMYDSPDKLKNDSIVDQDFFDNEGVTLEREGNVYALFKPEIYDEIKGHLDPKVLEMFDTYGPYQYRINDLELIDIDDFQLSTKPFQKEAGQWYTGQWNEETRSKEGRGITVFKDGSIYEGFWKK